MQSLRKVPRNTSNQRKMEGGSGYLSNEKWTRDARY